MKAYYLGIVATLVLIALYPLNCLFYAGSSVGDFKWRLEHGRVRVRHSPAIREQSFYVAINSGPLRFGLSWRWNSTSDWTLFLPLWLPLMIVAVPTLWARARRKKTAPSREQPAS